MLVLNKLPRIHFHHILKSVLRRAAVDSILNGSYSFCDSMALYMILLIQAREHWQGSRMLGKKAAIPYSQVLTEIR